MYPLDFEEFIQNCDPILFKSYQEINIKSNDIFIFQDKLTEYYKNYIFYGGLPEVVDT
jgi:predicted AAA+ superfamily ATPase